MRLYQDSGEGSYVDPLVVNEGAAWSHLEGLADVFAEHEHGDARPRDVATWRIVLT